MQSKSYISGVANPERQNHVYECVCVCVREREGEREREFVFACVSLSCSPVPILASRGERKGTLPASQPASQRSLSPGIWGAPQNLLLRTKESRMRGACPGRKTCPRVFFWAWPRFLEEQGRLWPHTAALTLHRPTARASPPRACRAPPPTEASPGRPVRATTHLVTQANPGSVP